MRAAARIGGARRVILALWGIFCTAFKILVVAIIAWVIGSVANSAIVSFLIFLPWGGYTLFNALRRHRKGRKEACGDGILIGSSYGYLAESSAGHSRNATPSLQGTDGACAIDYAKEPNPHVFIVGSTSSGKTTTARTFIGRAAARYGMPFLIIDWNGENEEWSESIGATLWKVPRHFKVNLFMLDGLSKEERAGVAVEGLTVAARLTPLQATSVKTALLKLYNKGGEPSLLELWKALHSSRNFNLLDQRLRAVQRVIGSEPKEFWESAFTRRNIISLKGLSDTEKLLASHSILRRIAELFDREMQSTTKPRLIVVIDEAWQLFKRERELDSMKESIAERIVRLGRKYGIGIVISTQQLDDVPKAFLNSCSLIMLHQQRESSYLGKDVLELGRFEKEYVKNAAQGEMLLFDRGRAQHGNAHPEYVKVTPLSAEESSVLKSAGAALTLEAIDEPEMPLEVEEAAPKKPEKEKQETQPKKNTIKIPDDVPTPKQYAGLLAIYNNKSGVLEELVKYISSKGWFTSPTTLYGTKGNPGIFQQLVNKGMVKESNGHYAITELGLKWVDPDTMMANQADKQGSEEHKQLMRKAIAILQEKLILAIIGKDKHSFDILGIPVNEKKRGLWDVGKAKGYEIQTSARKDSIDENIGKAKRWGVPMVWVAEDKKVLEEISKAAGVRDGYMEIK